jgi:transcriptional regulator with XRE-family HTH domain
MSRFIYDERREIARVFGENLDIIMEARGVSRVQLAELSGVSVSSIDNYRLGRCEPTAFAIIRLSRALRVSADKLLGIKEGRQCRLG